MDDQKRMELISALSSLRKKVGSPEELSKTVKEAVPELSLLERDLNEKVAKVNGITVSELINSPNFEKLKKEYRFSICEKVMNALKDTYGATNKEAFAFLVKMDGLI